MAVWTDDRISVSVRVFLVSQMYGWMDLGMDGLVSF